MDLIDPFSCQLHHIAFDRLKSHTPLPCPGTQSINIALKFHCVFFILNFTIANTVISKKSLGSWVAACLGEGCSFCLPRVPFVGCRRFVCLVVSLLVLRAGYGIWLYQFLIIAYLFTYFRLNIWWDVIYVQREQQGAKNGALGDTRQNRSPVRFYSIYNSSLFSEAKKRIYPFQYLATNSIAKQFAFKEFMRGCIKCLFKIQNECVNLSSVVQDFSPIIYYRSQLSFTTVSFPECMLPVWQEFIFIKMSHDIWTYYVFE